MNEKKLKLILQEGEGLTMEFKPSLSDTNRIVEVVCSFANSKGGTVLAGVSDNGNICGIDVGRQTIERLTNILVDNLDPRIYPEIIAHTINKKGLISIKVEESPDKPHLAFGKAFIRVGKSTKAMSRNEYERILLAKHKEKLFFDFQICKEAKLADLDRKKIAQFIRDAKKQRNLDIDENRSVEESLERLKLIQKRKITNAAVLLFCEAPQKFFLQVIIKAIRFKGTDVAEEMIDFKTVEGDIISQLKKTEDFIFEHIPKKAWIEEGKLQRQEKWLYPPKAIREALANALVHRDYRTTATIQIRIFDDRLEIWNPGCLPPELTVDKLKKKHDSIPRNPLLARAFFWVKYTEEVGTGTNKIIKWCKEWGLPEPDFEDTGSSLVVTFRMTKSVGKFLEKEGINKRQSAAMEYLKDHKKMSNRDYRELNNIGRVIAGEELSQMVMKKLLKRVGRGRSVKYILNDD